MRAMTEMERAHAISLLAQAARIAKDLHRHRVAGVILERAAKLAEGA